MSALPAFGDLKPPVKAALVVATGGGVMAGLGILFAKQWPIILAGMALIAVLILAYKAVLKLMDKRKQAPMLKALSGHSAGAPKGINDPAKRARLDDMRKNFEGGVDKFKDAGKNIYSLPWYLLVGEPGSGKTEAIRHCKVGFPPGLQDQLQGVGGTINMNWWFTNHAVILDTAGRLMFEEVEPGSTSEWQEFLKLLKKNRNNCPVNGMLLVIPSESLIKDNAEAIERKGGKIAQQLDQIQRALGVRFPVFVIVTKCDLINGFREFFDDLTEPQVQDQILGWSNPNPLDTSFNPEQVDQHLATVQQRLVRRRLGLMLDPVNTEDASRRRTDQVDALYAFPESFMKIAPRLRRYLEMIFVAGEWSAKPLFLRGIYFNSSMREGSALDADLAEALGMPVESLPEGRVWERDRAYFLRDLFLNKVFRERGLVTRAINTGQHLRKRKLAVFGTAAVGAVAITLFTIVGWLQLTKRVVAPGEFWVGVERAYAADLNGDRENANPLVKYQPGSGNEYLYTGHYLIRDVPARSDMQEDDKSVAGFPAALVEQAKDPIGLPAIFAPVAFLFGDNTHDLEKDTRRGAVGTVMEVSVLRPLVGLAQKKMREELAQPAGPQGGWSAEASEALVQLLRLEVDRLSGVKEPRPVSVTPLVRYLMGAEAFDKDPKRKEALARLDEAVRWEYSFAKDSAGKEEGHRKFPAVAIGSDFSDQLPEAVKRFRDSWKPDGSGTELALVTSIGDGLKTLSGHEAELQRLKASAALSDTEALAQWAIRLEAVRGDSKRVGDLLTQLRQKRPTDKSLAESHKQALKAYVENGRSTHQRMIGEVAGVADKDGGPPAIKPDPKTEQARFDALRRTHADLLASVAALEQTAGGGPERGKEIEGYDALFLRGATKDDAYAVRLGMYEEADKRAAGAGTVEAIQLGTLKPRMDALKDGLDESRAKVTQMEAAARGDKELPKDLQEKMAGAVAIANYALDKGAAVKRGAMVSEWIRNLPETPADFGKAVEGYAEASKAPAPAHPTIPMTVGAVAGKFDAKYNPDAAAALLGDCAAVLVLVPPSAGEAAAGVATGPIAAASVEKVKKVYDGYAQAFLGYWSSDMRKHIKVDVPTKGWTAFANELAVNSQTDTFNRALSELATTISKAVSTVKPVIKPDPGPPLPGRPAALTPDAILAQVELTRATLGNDVSSKNFRTVHQQWRALSPTASAARKTVLDAANRFTDDYMPVRPAGYDGAAPLGDFATAFWEDLALTALERLALQCRDEGEDALRRLRANKRFPLGPLGPDGQQLLPPDVVDMADYISKVGVQAPGGGGSPPPGATAPPLPAPGGKADASANLAILRNPTKLEEGDSKWLQWAASMLAGLPTRKDEAFSCTISYLKGPDSEIERSTQFIWLDMGLAQGPTVLPPQRVREEEVKELGKVRYPGDDLRLRFFKNAASTADVHEFKVPAPWPALRLLYDGFAAAPPEKMGDARTWKVNVLIDDPAGGKRSLWLKLEFQQELPDPRTWPR